MSALFAGTDSSDSQSGEIHKPAWCGDVEAWNVSLDKRCFAHDEPKAPTMERPLQTTFRGMDSSPALEALIRERVNRLETLYPRLTGCRVVVEVPYRGSASAKVPLAVSVEADVPGRAPILGRDEAERHEAKEDHTAAVNNAFEAVERQLARISDVRSHEVKTHAADSQAGMIVRLYPDQNYGFVQIENSPELYFTRNAVVGASYDELKVGMMVQITPAIDEGPMGPQASSVRLLDRGRTPT